MLDSNDSVPELERLTKLLGEYRSRLIKSQSMSNREPPSVIHPAEMRNRCEKLLEKASRTIKQHEETERESMLFFEAKLRFGELEEALYASERNRNFPHGSGAHVNKLLELLREYSDRLLKTKDKVAELTKKDSWGTNVGLDLEAKRFSRIQRNLHDLARAASQVIEHSVADDTARIEMKLRLSEFESLLEEVSGRLERR